MSANARALPRPARWSLTGVGLGAGFLAVLILLTFLNVLPITLPGILGQGFSPAEVATGLGAALLGLVIYSVLAWPVTLIAGALIGLIAALAARALPDARRVAGASVLAALLAAIAAWPVNSLFGYSTVPLPVASILAAATAATAVIRAVKY